MILMLPIIAIITGLMFIVFNKKLVQLEAKIKNRKGKMINENLVKTQFYIAGGLSLLGGLIVFAMAYKSFN